VALTQTPRDTPTVHDQLTAALLSDENSLPRLDQRHHAAAQRLHDAPQPPLGRHAGGVATLLVNIAVISDLHLGSEDVTDSFGHEDSDFLRFLTFLERNFERIVLLGDIWETLTVKCPWRARQGLAHAKSRHPEIARRFARPRYKYIHGNHDLIARRSTPHRSIGVSTRTVNGSGSCTVMAMTNCWKWPGTWSSSACV
jgi:hypothetical protein